MSATDPAQDDHVLMAKIGIDSKADKTFQFDPAGREQYSGLMIDAGYVEFPGYPTEKAYCCGNCPSMADDKASPTGYTCRKFQFPDKPFGCCDGWSPREPQERPK